MKLSCCFTHYSTVVSRSSWKSGKSSPCAWPPGVPPPFPPPLKPPLPDNRTAFRFSDDIRRRRTSPSDSDRELLLLHNSPPPAPLAPPPLTGPPSSLGLGLEEPVEFHSFSQASGVAYYVVESFAPNPCRSFPLPPPPPYLRSKV